MVQVPAGKEDSGLSPSGSSGAGPAAGSREPRELRSKAPGTRAIPGIAVFHGDTSLYIMESSSVTVSHPGAGARPSGPQAQILFSLCVFDYEMASDTQLPVGKRNRDLPYPRNTTRVLPTTPVGQTIHSPGKFAGSAFQLKYR